MGVEGLSSAVSGLFAHRKRLDVISNNIANVNTDGYSKQRVDLVSVSGAATGIWSGSSSSLGGVNVAGISRSRDAFMEMRAADAHSTAAQLGVALDYQFGIESALAEPTDQGIAAALDDLWAGFDDVANFPDQIPQRTALINTAQTLADRLGSADSAFRQLHNSAFQQTETIVGEINALANEVATLNKAISSAPVAPNDLLDQRDRATARLAELTGARVVERDRGTADVYIGNSTLVQGSRTFELSVQETVDPAFTAVGLNRTDIMIEGTVRLTSATGALGGTLGAMNGTIPDAIRSLDDVAASLTSTVNGIHATGFDMNGNPGAAFFTGTTASTIEVNATIVADPATLAASNSATNVRDGSIATAIADLRDSDTGADALYETFVVQTGMQTNFTERRAVAQSQAADALEDARLSARSVSLDEEMVDLVEAQRAYEAAARVVTTIDEMLDTLVNRLGTVGR